MHRIRDIFLQLVQSLWFLPALVAAAHAALAIALVWFDIVIVDGSEHGLPSAGGNLFDVTPDGARSMLGTIAGALITALGVTLSGVLVALSLAASQYTSRILRDLTGRRSNQIALGQILGPFVYVLVVLVTIDSGNDDRESFVPEVATLVGVILGVVGVSALVLFVHNVSRAIQVGEILATIARHTEESLRKALPERGSDDDATDMGVNARDDREHDVLGDLEWTSVPASRSGYLRSIDAKVLAEHAAGAGMTLRMECEMGAFLVAGAPLVSFVSDGAIDAEARAELQHSVEHHAALGSFRTVEQDPGYGLRQMVDIALRALSPGVNDTTTSVMAIHRIRQCLALAASRGESARLVRVDGHVRFVRRCIDLEKLVVAGFTQIRRAAHGNIAASDALVDSLLFLARATHREDVRRALRTQAEALRHNVQRSIDREREDFADDDWRGVLGALEALDAYVTG